MIPGGLNSIMLGQITSLSINNILRWTEKLTNSLWDKSRIFVTEDSIVAPDLTTSADTITTIAVSGIAFRLWQNSTITNSNCVFSVYVKENGYSQIALRETTSTGSAAVFDLTTGTVDGTYSTGGVSVSSPSITDEGGGWYRISATFSGTNNKSFAIYILNGAWTSGSVEYSWTANGTSGIYAWGANMTLGTTLLPYEKRE